MCNTLVFYWSRKQRSKNQYSISLEAYMERDELLNQNDIML